MYVGRENGDGLRTSADSGVSAGTVPSSAGPRGLHYAREGGFALSDMESLRWKDDSRVAWRRQSSMIDDSAIRPQAPVGCAIREVVALQKKSLSRGCNANKTH